MQKLKKFWQKDLINKLILLVSFSVVAVVLALIVVLITMPEDKSLAGAVYESLPIINPTLNTQSALTIEAATALAKPTETLTLMPPTITSLPTLPIRPTATPATQFAASNPAPTGLASSATVNPSPSVTSTFTSAPTVVVNKSCIPTGPVQTGVVVEVLDGSTIRVLIESLVYTVRYIGIELPQNINYAELAKYENTLAVYGKEIRLIADENDKDARGRLLRYVTAGEVFVNLDLLEKGLATVSESDTDFACLASFKAAEQNSYNMKSGLWSLPQTIPTP